MTTGYVAPVPFTSSYRGSGSLMHVTSLPSAYGIGDVGPGALAWIDRLHDAGQTWWQTLPLGPTGYGNSPYQPLSSFADNELVISPDWLIEEGLLQVGEAQPPDFPRHEVDYNAVIPFKHELLAKSWNHFKSGARSDLRPAFEQFQLDEAHWLDDYALFQALKIRLGGVYYLEWPAELIERQSAALDRARKDLADHVARECFVQFLLFRQTERLKAHARCKGVNLIGDLPFFVSPDSSDVWANPEMFLLDERRHPRFVAGVPPDYFSAQGQLWGNPVYDWDALRRDGYGWWIRRLRSRLNHVDVIRLDHFRGFTAAWHVNAGAATAEVGEWKPGPGAELFSAVRRELGSLPFIAEDLGQITPDVYTLRDQFHLPGMRILQFAFDGHSDNPHLPDNYATNTVVYTGTHDNPPTRSWFEALPDDQKRTFRNYVRGSIDSQGGPAAVLMGLAWSSSAALAMAPLQDVLNLGNEARMNIPGRPGGNWRWRCTEDSLSCEAFEKLRELTESSSRLTAVESPVRERELEVVSR